MFYLAYRQLLSRKKQTLLIVLGISFGTMIYVLIAGIQLGMREYIKGQLLNNTAHIRITGRERLIDEKDLRERFFSENDFVKWITPPSGKRDEARLENYLGWHDRLESDPQVLSFAPKLSVNGIATRGDQKSALSLTGIIPSRQLRVTQLEDYMKEGSLKDLESGGNKIVLGSGVIEELGARLYDNIMVTVGVGEARPFKLVGSIHLGNKDVDDRLAFAYLKDVQQLNRTPGRISEIGVALTNIDRSREIADRWSLYSKDKVENWEDANPAFQQIIAIQDISRIIITVAILVVAGFGIYNVLSIMISQKQREIAILRSMGYAPVKILELFLIQGLLLGVVGAILGIGMGYGLEVFFGSIDLGFEIGQGRNLIMSYEAPIYIVAFWAAQLAAFIASLVPAYHASRLTPIDIIRGSS